MKRRYTTFALAVITALTLINCRKTESAHNGKGLLLALLASGSQPIGQSISSGLSATADAASGATDSGGNAVALFPGQPAQKSSPFDRALAWFDFSSSALPATPLAAADYILPCGGGTATRHVTGTDFGAGAAVDAVWTFSNCGNYGFTGNGTIENEWSGLDTVSPYLQNGTILQVAPNYTVNGTYAGQSAAVTQSGNLGSSGTTTGKPRAHTLTFSAATASSASYSINSDVTWTGNLNGSRVFQHTITTPTPLSVTWNKAGHTRTVNSGVQSISHDLANFTVQLTYSSVVFNYKTCLPVSGSISFSVTGSITGTGLATFQNGQVDYTFTGTNARGSNVSENGTIYMQGCSMK